MTPAEYLSVLRGDFLSASPSLLVWAAALVFGIVMYHRERGAAPACLTAGAGIRLGAGLLGVARYFLIFWAVNVSTAHPPSHAAWWTASEVIIDIISAAGIVFLLYAFWLKVRPEATPTVRPPELVQ